MDTKNQQYFDWICRTCMNEVGEIAFAIEHPLRQWQSIFDPAEECGGALLISELLSSTTPQIEVKLCDDMPKKICHACLKQLTSVHHFQQMCIQSDREIREMIAKTYTNLNEAGSDVPATAHALHFEVIEQRHEAEAVETMPKEKQLTIISDPLQNVAGIENFRDSQDIKNGVKNEPCDANDEYVYADNHQEALYSTIEVKEEAVRVNTNDSSKYVCALCNIKFKESRYLKRHMKRHALARDEKTKEIPQHKPKSNFDHYRFQCDICNSYFLKPETLYKHRLVHEGKTEQKLKACNVCGNTFSTRYTLTAHKIKEHSTENTKKRKRKEYSCEICKKNIAYNCSTEIQNHIRTHTGERPFLCSECGKSFASAGNLRQHRFRHSDVRPFECPICPARFHCRGDIIKHKITHEAIKRHICDVCGEGFGKNYELTAHKKYHSGEKPFKCDYCEKRSFVRLDQQRRHVRTHTGEKPYKCKICERAFAQPNDQIKHLRTHLGENVYGCTLCPSAFRLASERRAHFATHKNDDEETRERNMKALKDKEAKLQLKFFKNESQQLLIEDSIQQADPVITI